MRSESQQEVSAVSPEGGWRFTEGCLRSSVAVIKPFAIDFFERWTFARFMREGILALGFESGQPYSPSSHGGSYGDRYGGVQVVALTAPAQWDLVAIEYDSRRVDETFIPDDVTWHSRGVLAWLRNGFLYVQVLREPRGAIAEWELLPRRDSDQGLAYCFEERGAWKTLTLDENGYLLTARDEEGIDVFDLEKRRRARKGGDWRPRAG
ncbi:hypothetical protein J5X84_08580 [Streptosporangiaceae bacterium NEAU-GS5]|nr:hypothetical protein [Streptosporangiaceae bacterium NEAU-GS5]